MILDLEIESLSYGGGRGVARFEQFVYFVPFTAPGDQIRAEVTFQKKNYGEARLIEILKPSPKRTEPLCPMFGVCGGCRFQHVTYDEQLAQKNSYIKRALLGLEVGELHEIHPNPEPYFYRNRIQVHVRGQKIGFLQAKSNDLVQIEGCPISEKPIHSFLGDTASRRRVLEKNSEKVEIYLDPDLKVQLRGASEAPESSQFSQVNRAQNEFMIQMILKRAALAVADRLEKPFSVLDLYAGSGNLTFPLFETLGVPTMGVELSSVSVQKAKARSSGAGSKLLFTCQGVFEYLKTLRSGSLSETLVVTDPPREGLTRKVIEEFARLKPFAVIHVGCDLMNFSRDLRDFEKRGYKTLWVQPLDMFPQTDHVELIAHLVPAELR